jgi:hypothetical protein
MVTGLELFRKYFQDYPQDYILIGGVACELVLDTMHLRFRPTDDFDVVIVSEHLKSGFGAALKRFICDGGYTVQHRKSNNRPTFFRFVDPENGDFPAKLELATDKPAKDWIFDFAPLDAGDEKSSLSAILFENNYYNFICSNTSIIQGVTTIALEGLIPLKALAFSELSKIKSPSEKILINMEKHVGDIFRLANALSGEQFQIPQEIAENLSATLTSIAQSPVSNEQRELLEHIRHFYRLAR